MNKPQDNLTPMMRQYLEIKGQHRDAFLFFRMGDFYEMFFEDALQASKILDIALTSRNKGEGDKVPFCGVPYHSASQYIRKLLEEGHKVALCEQVEDPKAAKGIVRREVTRVITPGLMVEEEQLGSSQANYLASVTAEGKGIHLALADISTGEILSGFYEKIEGGLQELLKHPVRELLVPDKTPDLPWLADLRKQNPHLLITPFQENGQAPLASQNFSEALIASLREIRSTPAGKNLGFLLGYILKTQRCPMPHLGPVTILKAREFMGMDERTFRHLELTRNQRGEGRGGTLFSVLNKTRTAMGARRLTQWIHYPLMDLTEITRRQEAVADFLEQPELLSDLQSHLEKIQDIERMLGKLSLGTVNARDLRSLGDSLEVVRGLMQGFGPKFHAPLLQQCLREFPGLWRLGEALRATLRENPPLTVREGGMIAGEIHPELDELRDLSRDGKNFIAQMELQERRRTGIATLKIRYNRVFGYYIEVTHTHRDSVPMDYVRKQTLTNAERYITPQLKEYENKVLGAEERIKNLEFEIFSELRTQCAGEVEPLRRLSDQLAKLDALASLAQAARENRYARPRLVAEKCLNLRESRHPVLEKALPAGKFIPNDIAMSSGEERLFLITGPNMAGKSTVMRQAALSIIMAQMGGYVPAAEATVGLVDQLFTRIGASDDLTQNQSTFMVEMLEAGHILRSATERSFIVMDEIGRGTSTYDGMSIAWAVTEYVAQTIRCRAMFATHYHELIEMGHSVAGIANYQVAVKEWNDEILFLRKLVPGGASRSYGIEVARLAHLPGALLERAKEILKKWEVLEERALQKIEAPAAPLPQMDLFGAIPSEQRELIEDLRNLDPQRMTPLQALQYLYKIKERLS